MNSPFTRRDVRIPSGGHTLAGWCYTPSAGPEKDRYPAIVMAHGWSAVKEMYLDDYAACFAARGFVVTVFDYRGFGASDGEPRQHINPAQQQEDYKNAITWTQLQPTVDAQRIGVWGSSFSGAHALHLGAFDRRVKAVVAQVPLVDGARNFQRLVRGDHWAGLHAMLAEDRLQEARTGELSYLPVVAEQGAPQALPTPDSYTWFMETSRTRAPSWKNENSLRSLELALEYNPGASIHLISPTPLLMIVAEFDVLAATELALEAYARALEPKRLELLPGGHFDAYTVGFERSSRAAADWFVRHLQ